MKRNFDEEWEDRKSVDKRMFQVCGEQFLMRASVRPEVFDREPPKDDAPLSETMREIDEQILALIEPGDNGEAHNRYRALREREDNTLSVRDLTEILNWLIEEQTGRPPTSLSDSPDGPTRIGTRSRGSSSSRDLQAV